MASHFPEAQSILEVTKAISIVLFSVLWSVIYVDVHQWTVSLYDDLENIFNGNAVFDKKRLVFLFPKMQIKL